MRNPSLILMSSKLSAKNRYFDEMVKVIEVNQGLVDKFIADTLKMCEHTAFVGLRGDGVPLRAYNRKSLGGDWGKTREEIHAVSVTNLRRLRENSISGPIVHPASRDNRCSNSLPHPSSVAGCKKLLCF